jgi:hypothetical protein
MADRVAAVDVPVNLEDIEKLVTKFDAYRDALAQTPGQWKAAGKELSAMATQVEKIDAALRSQKGTQQEEAEADKERNRRLRENEGLWDKMSRHSSAMSKNVLDIGNSLLKWGGLLAGGALFGSIFGIDRLAHSIGDTRSQSMGLGMSPAALQAFNVNFGGKGLDTQGFLSSMLGMETDVTKRAPWYMLAGGKPMTGDTTADSLSYMQSVRDFTQRTDKSMLGTLGAAYQIPFGAQDLNKIQDMKPGEWSALISSVQRDQKSFGLSNSGAKAWQDLSIQFERVSTLLKDKFAIALEPIAQKLVDLSLAAGNLVAAFLKAPEVKDAITGLTGWLDGLTKSMKGDDFKKSIADMSASVGTITEILHGLAEAMGFLKNWVAPFSDKKTPHGLMETGEKFQTDARSWEVKGLADLWARLTGGPRAEVTDSVARDSPFAQQRQRYGGDTQAALASLALGDAAMDKVMKAHPNDWQKYTSPDMQKFLKDFQPLVDQPSFPKDTAAAGGKGQINFPRGSTDPLTGESFFAPQGTGVTVLIINATGGNAAVAAHQLGSN